MQYFHFKTERGNFGDDLNPWLWKQFFGEEFNSDNRILLGIGTFLYNNFSCLENLDPNTIKIVFGSGIRHDYQRFKLNNTWDIRFLRGPLSASVLNNRFRFITDSAYALRQTKNFDKFLNVPKKFEIGVMPYFRSVNYFDWNKICEKLNFHFISPFSKNGVEATISEIAACKHIIAEAMHGAIVADILRVPWSRYVLTTPFTEGSMISEFKWMDWLHSIRLGSIDTTFIKFYKEPFMNRHLKRLNIKMFNFKVFINSITQKDIIKKLSSKQHYNLSTDITINVIDQKISEEIEKLKLSLR